MAVCAFAICIPGRHYDNLLSSTASHGRHSRCARKEDHQHGGLRTHVRETTRSLHHRRGHMLPRRRFSAPSLKTLGAMRLHWCSAATQPTTRSFLQRSLDASNRFYITRGGRVSPPLSRCAAETENFHLSPPHAPRASAGHLTPAGACSFALFIQRQPERLWSRSASRSPSRATSLGGDVIVTPRHSQATA